jgi:hypothetical protein
LTKPFHDPHFAPPADLTDAEARAYEEAVLATITEALRLGRYGSWIIESIELEGRRPNTAVVFKYREGSDPGRLLAARASIWEGLVETVCGRERLESAPSHAGHLWSAFDAGELEAYEVS